MEFKSVEALEKRISEILTKREAEITATEKELDKATRELHEAETAMEEATRVTDLKGYMTAKERAAEARVKLEMYGKRRDALEQYDLITPEEYRARIAEVKEEAEKLDREAREKLVKLSDEMYQAIEKLRDFVIKANPLIGRWQEQIYRGRDKAGAWQRTIYIDKYSTMLWGYSGVSTDQYGTETGKKFIINTGKFEPTKKEPAIVTKDGKTYKAINEPGKPMRLEEVGAEDD